jgi:beta-glucosidase
MKRSIFLIMMVGILFASCKSEQPDYLNVKLSFERRVDDLVSRMTLEQKAAQLIHDTPGIDSLHIPPHNWFNDCTHGVSRSGIATVFPQTIGMAAMWDDEAMFRIATAISDEARAKHHAYAANGNHWMYQGLCYWSPNINIFRDPRWGRGMETCGEDPYLTGVLGVNYIKGLQGDNPRYFKLIAAPKHFAVHSGPESLRHSMDVHPSEYDFLDTYTPHFKKAIQEGGAYAVMCAYQRLWGIPCCGSLFIDNLLRNEWGFQGHVVSDCGAIHDIFQKNSHHLVETEPQAWALAIKAGTDMNCFGTHPPLLEAVEQGLISEAEIDVSVKRMMMARMRLGQFDPPEMVPYIDIPYSVVDSKEHRELALEATRKSIVLLKNKDNILPLSKDIKKIAVIGPNADGDDVFLGNYNGFPSNLVTPLEGIRKKLPDAEVVYAQGCPVAPGMHHLRPIPVDALYTDPTLTTAGLKAEYFDNDKLEGEPKHVRTDACVDFEWFNAPPFEDLQYDRFSVRWSGVIVPPVTGDYEIGGEAFRKFDLFFENELLLTFNSGWEAEKISKTRRLEAGKSYSVKMEYIQRNSEYAMARILWEKPNPDIRREAVELAKNSDLVILCMGISSRLEGEEKGINIEGFKGGDRLDINLPAVQSELIREIHATGKPAVLVLISGSALAVNWEDENIPAIIEAWYPGQAGGTAIADVLFGDYNPAGRLPVTFYRSVDDIPAFENYDMRGKTYRYFEGKPLYEFGYGLSYTQFEYNNLVMPGKAKTDKNIPVSVEVTNTGKYAGDEVVQLYISHIEAKRRVAIRSLQGFKRIHLNIGETKTVNFILTPEQLSQIDGNRRISEPGTVRISVGGKQPDEASVNAKKVVEKIVMIE